MKRPQYFALIPLLTFILLVLPTRALADPGASPNTTASQLALVTSYPDRIIGIGETVDLKLTLQPAPTLQILQLSVDQLPEGWTATFRGDGQIVSAVEVTPNNPESVDLRLDPPADVKSGNYQMTVEAKGDGVSTQLPIDLTVKEKLPARLSFDAPLPTIKGAPNSVFRYSVELKNEGDEDLNVNLSADSSSNFLIKFKSSAQEVTTLPVGANKSENISVEAQPLGDVPAGNYPIKIYAQGGDVQTEYDLQADVIGQSQLSVTAPDGRLSGQATSGKETPFKIVLQNTGTASAYGVQLTSTEPSGWSVVFDTNQVAEVPAGQQVDVTARIKPPDKAISGDYVVTVKAQPVDGATTSADYRITVVTSTIWGIVGIGLIAVSVAIVGIAVTRFGRR